MNTTHNPDTLITAIVHRVSPHLEVLQDEFAKALAADTDNGVIGSLLEVQARLKIAQRLVDAAIELHGLN